ncbi:hypothetical protein VZT92_014580 [Zoarces viviparus]|uniref:Uncharacterized protein n=1 Tax=Zoarces viviparus TaxID=48416 RepID=A0AAW1F0I5_ZOAVI
MPPFEARRHHSSTVASTKPPAYIMDWPLILEAIIYLSHIGCQMDVCPEKKKELKRSKSGRKDLRGGGGGGGGGFSRGYRKLHGPDGKTRQSKREIRWLLMSVRSTERSFKCCNYLGGTGLFPLEDLLADR